MNKLNDKGFAITTIVYAIIILLSLVMLSILTILKQEYDDQKTYINDINEGLSGCLSDKTC